MDDEIGVVDLLQQWAAWAPQDPGDAEDFPRAAAFDWMAGGSVGMPAFDERQMETVDRAVAGLERVYKHVIKGHFRKHASYYRLANELRITPEQVGVLVAAAIEKVGDNLCSSLAA